MTLEEQISQLDLSTYPILDVERIISNIGSIGLEVYPVQKGSTMQRVLPVSAIDNIDLVSRLSYNPCPKKYGRANVPRSPMFYACFDIPNINKTANEMIVSFFEGRAFRSETAIFSKWIVKETLHVGCIIHPLIFPGTTNKFLITLKNLYVLLLKENRYRNPHLDKALKQVCEQFSKRFPDNNDYNYLFTALFSQKLIAERHFDGILYPSVQTGGDVCMNIALTKDAADRKISFMKARKSSIYLDDNGEYNTAPLRRAVSQDGKTLIWSDVRGGE